MNSLAERQSLVKALFPESIPPLWCPTLTHFLSNGQLDVIRIRRHVEFLAPYSRGVLVPGSTGEGWDMNDREVRQLLEVVINAAGEYGVKILIGVLRKETDDMLRVIRSSMQWLTEMTHCPGGLEALLAANVAGFTVCPPSGSELTQNQILSGLSCVLELGYPTALYQLPQVTENEMSPACVAQLAADFPNFYLFKDTSGTDRVAAANLDLQGVFLVRGAEGRYHQWPRSAGGPYDGFLLSTANCFARQFVQIIDLLANNQDGEAEVLSQRISRVVSGCFAAVDGFPAGNPFTNANKILDHVMAHGPQWHAHPTPYLHGGRQLPLDFVQTAHRLLAHEELVPERGYLL